MDETPTNLREFVQEQRRSIPPSVDGEAAWRHVALRLGGELQQLRAQNAGSLWVWSAWVVGLLVTGGVIAAVAGR